MKKKIFWIIGAMSLFAIIAINMSLATPNVNNRLTFAQIEAIGFEFNGQNWDTDSHWYNALGIADPETPPA
jgi:hypothetical protein